MKNLMNKKFSIKWVWTILGLAIFGCFYTLSVYAGDNHVHIEQVSGGDNVDIDITQIGYDNEINFSFHHQNNVFDLSQTGSGNYIGYVSYWD